MMKTTLPTSDQIKRDWYVVDATDKPAGRLAASIANVLRGKTKAIYTPHLDTGDFVVVVNAEKVRLTGGKEDKKIYKDYSGYPSGLTERPAHMIRSQDPTRILTQAVRGMLPKNRLGRRLIRKLKVYSGPNHPHEAQQPVELQLP